MEQPKWWQSKIFVFITVFTISFLGLYGVFSLVEQKNVLNKQNEPKVSEGIKDKETTNASIVNHVDADANSKETSVNNEVSKGFVTSDAIRLLSGDGTLDNPSFVVLADGYTKIEREDFFEDAGNLAADIFDNKTFKPFEENYNVYGVMVESKNSSLENESPIIDSFFASESRDRDIMLPERVSKKNHLDPTYVIVLINSPRFIGFTIRTNEVAKEAQTVVTYVSSDFQERGQNILHELGHVIADLGDEYYPIDKKPYHKEAPNLTRFREMVPWRNFIGNSDIGVFSVGDTGWYRPTEDCIMMGLKLRVYPNGYEEFIKRDYCPICYKAISEALRSQVVN